MNYPRRISGSEFERNRDERRREDRGRKRQRRSVQDFILGRCKARNIPLEINLKNEVKIIGQIIAYDNWTIFVDEGSSHILIFKSGILCLKPLKPLDTRNIISYPTESDIDLKDDKSPYFYRDRDVA